MRTPTYEDHIKATWPWEFTAEVEMDIPELDITLISRCDGYQEYEGAEDVIDWDDFYECAEPQGVDDVDEFIDENEKVLSSIILNDTQREKRSQWVIKDRS